MIRVGVVILFKVCIHVYMEGEVVLGWVELWYQLRNAPNRCLSSENEPRLTGASGCLDQIICLGQMIKQQQQLPFCADKWGRFNDWSLEAVQSMDLRQRQVDNISWWGGGSEIAELHLSFCSWKPAWPEIQLTKNVTCCRKGWDGVGNTESVPWSNTSAWTGHPAVLTGIGLWKRYLRDS